MFPGGMLAIGELVARTGVREATLRMWEQRHGFPAPERLASGHRRYREEDVELVQRVLRERAAGLSLGAAIARVRAAARPDPSIFAGLRRRRPELQPIVLRKPALLALTRAIEDESCAQAERGLLFGAFQRERFYRRSERRWRSLARTAELAVVFADFERVRMPAGAPVELPIARADPLTREWAVVCAAPGHAVCLAGLELPGSSSRRDGRREFEVVWSVEPEVVRTATQICLELARRSSARLAERLPGDDGLPPSGPPSDRQLRLAAAIATRTLERIGR
jgi:MerR family transcriptional regulator, light-induced transcriptional regulator